MNIDLTKVGGKTTLTPLPAGVGVHLEAGWQQNRH